MNQTRMIRDVMTVLAALTLVVACGGTGSDASYPNDDGVSENAACLTSAECTKSFCDGTWPEGTCKVATDCGGYVAKAGGYRPPAPNKRCVDGRCHQVGSCNNHHS